MTEVDRIVLEPERREIEQTSPTTVWRQEKADKHPKRRQISPGRVGWLLSELQEFINDPEGWAERHEEVA